MSVGRAGSIVVKLDLDGDRFTSKISGATDDLGRFLDAIRKTNTGLQTNERQVTSWGRRFRDTVIVIGLARHALMNLNDLLLSFPRAVLRSNAELEKMEMLMVGLSDATGGYDSALQQASDSVDYVFDMARTAPFEVASLTDSFVKMKAAGIDPANGALQAMVDSVAKFGGSSEHLKRASIAIQQMSGKGVISMEELRQQLGEAVPNAVMVMARALDLSMGDLVQKISMGVVQANAALSGMFRQMTLENSGAALRMSSTYDGIMARLKTRFIDFHKIIGDAGAFKEAKESLRQFTDEFMTSSEVAAFAKGLGESMAYLITEIRKGTKWLLENRELVLAVGEALIKLKLAHMAYGIVLSHSIAIKSAWTKVMVASSVATAAFSLEMGKANARIIKQTVVAHSAAGIMGVYNAIVLLLTTSIRAMGAALVALARSIGAANLIVGAIIAVMWGLYEVWSRLTDKGKELKDVLADFDPNFATSASIEELNTALAETEAKIKRIEDARIRLQAPNAQQNYGYETTFALATQDTTALQADAELARILLNQAAATKAQKDADVELLRASADRAEKSIEIQAKYVRDLEALRAEIWAGEGSQEEKREELMLRRQAHDEENINEQMALIEAQVVTFRDRLNKAIAEGGSNQLQLMLHESILALEGEAEELNKLRIPLDGLIIVEGSGQKSPFDTWLENIQKKVATVGAKIADVSPEFEKFKVMLESGDFGSLDDAEMLQMLATAKDITDELLAQQNIWDAQQESIGVLRRETKNTLEIQASLTKKVMELNNDNPFRQAETDVEGFRTQLNNTIETLTASQQAISDVGGEFDQGLADGIANARIELERLEGVRVEGVISYMRREADKIISGLGTTRENIDAAYRQQLVYIEEIRKANQGLFSPEQIAEFEEYIRALSLKYAKDTQSPVQNLVEQWLNASDRIKDVWATAMQDFSTTLTDALVDGEMKFKDFAKNILKMILQIQLQKMIAGIVDYAIGGSTSMVGPPKPDGSFAMGGIMTSGGPAMLRKYSKGGIARGARYSEFGEGDDPEAYVPLPDGRSIPVNVNMSGSGSSAPGETIVNVINQTSTPVSAEQGQVKFDGSRFVRDVFLREISRPGPFRDAVRGASGG